MAASHENSYTLYVSISQLIAAIRDPAFSTTLNVEMKSENPTPPGVWYRFHHGVSFTSWGEKITITLHPMGEAVTHVRIHSECGMPTQVIDWGKNQQVVCNIYEYLEANVRRYPAGPAPFGAPQAAPQFQPQAAPVAAPQPQVAPETMAQAPAEPLPQFQPQTAPKFCPKCGTPATGRFCAHCGNQLQQ